MALRTAPRALAASVFAQVQGGEKQLYAAWVSPAFTCVLLFFVSGVRSVGEEASGPDPEAF